jgi:hypothetical protein
VILHVCNSETPLNSRESDLKMKHKTNVPEQSVQIGDHGALSEECSLPDKLESAQR